MLEEELHTLPLPLRSHSEETSGKHATIDINVCKSRLLEPVNFLQSDVSDIRIIPDNSL